MAAGPKPYNQQHFLNRLDFEEGVLVLATQPEAEAGSGTGLMNATLTGQAIAKRGLTGKTLYVDSVNGNDVTGARGTSKPFLTPAAAKTAASSGDTIMVGPGSYTVTASLAKNGVNWNFAPGASVTKTSTVDAPGIFDDEGAAMSFTVFGYGDFTHTNLFFSSNVVKTSHADSIIVVFARDITLNGSLAETAGAGAVIGGGGGLRVTARNIVGTGDIEDWFVAGVVWTESNKMEVSADYISGWRYGIWTLAFANDLIVHANEINGGVWTADPFSESATWIDCIILRGSSLAGVPYTGSAVYSENSGKLYVHAQKIYGYVGNNLNGLIYVETMKHVPIMNSVALFVYSYAGVGNGSIRYRATHMDPLAFTGPAIQADSGTIFIEDSAYIGTAGSGGASVALDGTLRMKNSTISTLLNNATNPVTKSGGTLILDDCSLVSHATRDSISAATAQNVKIYGRCQSNKAIDADVTLQVGTVANGGFVVSTDVV